MSRCSLLIGLLLLGICAAFARVPHSSSLHRRPTARRIPSAAAEVWQQDQAIGQKDASSCLFVSAGGSTACSRPVTVSPHTLSKQQMVYLMLTSTFITCLIVADVIGVKIFELKLPFSVLGCSSVEHTCGMLTFPLTFILGDVINEYFGPKATKATVYIGLAMSILVFLVMNLAQALPYLQKPFNVSPAAFDMVFGSAKLMYVASICAYLLGQLMDIWLFGVLKKLTKGNYLWVRATGSTIISQLLDSFVVSYIAFSLGKTLNNQVPATMREVVNIAMTGYGLKFVLAGLMTPLLYVARHVMSTRFGLEPLPIDYRDDDDQRH